MFKKQAGKWSIDEGLMEWVLEYKRVLELGSGYSTLYMRKNGVDVVAVEHEKSWADFTGAVLFAKECPQKKCFYKDFGSFLETLEPVEAVLVDGPKSEARSRLFDYVDLLGSPDFLLDDMGHPENQRLANNLADYYERDIEFGKGEKLYCRICQE